MTEPINVILLTYGTNENRTKYAVRTAKAAVSNLIYPELNFYVADDGSSVAHIEAVLDCFKSTRFIGWHTIPFGSYGQNANKAIEAVKSLGKLTFWLEDDWELCEPLDLYPYAALLMEREDVGMVRLGYLNLNMRGQVFGHSGKLYWRLDRTADSYVFTGHPSLRHERFANTYGRYPEGLMPGETELGYATQYRNGNGPDIVWPVENGSYGKFAHIGNVQSY
jgi:hypothetical protein